MGIRRETARNIGEGTFAHEFLIIYPALMNRVAVCIETFKLPQIKGIHRLSGCQALGKGIGQARSADRSCCNLSVEVSNFVFIIGHVKASGPSKIASL